VPGQHELHDHANPRRAGLSALHGRREDTLRRVADDSFRIAGRRILVDQTVITATNLSILF
jgi:hypothetical protein